MSNKHTFWAPNISSDLSESATPSVAVVQSLLKGYEVKLDEHSLWAVNQQVGSPQTLHELAKRVEPLGFEVELLTVPADLLLSTPHGAPWGWSGVRRDLSVFPILVAGRADSWASSPDTALDTGLLAWPLERFIVIWNKVGPFFQVVDSQSRRCWLRHADLKALLAKSQITLSPRSSQDVLESESFKSLLRSRLHHLGVDATRADEIYDAFSGEGRGEALLDAAARMVERMVQDRAVHRGKSALEVLRVLVEHVLRDDVSAVTETSVIPEEYWSIEVASLHEAPAAISLRAVAALRVYGWDEEKFKKSVAAHKASAEVRSKNQSVAESPEQEQILRTSADASPLFSSFFDLAKFFLADGMLPPTMWIGIMIMAATGIFFQAILFRGMMNLVTNFNTLSQRLWLVALISAFITTLLLLQWFIQQIGNSMGQRLNSRLRLTLFSMLPNLSSHYFRDTSPAEMIDRIHSGRAAQWLPLLLQFTLLGILQVLFTVAGLAWIDGLSGLLAAFMVLALVFGMVARMQLQEKQLEVLEQRGTLSQFYRDAMQGLVAIRTHSAEQAARREYESRLSTWGKKKLDLHVSEMWFWAYDGVTTYILISLIIVLYAVRTTDPSNLLLLAYWCINIDQIGRNQLAVVVMGLLFSFSDLKRYGTILEIPAERDLMPGPNTAPTGMPARPTPGPSPNTPHASGRRGGESFQGEVASISAHSGPHLPAPSAPNARGGAGMAIAIRQVWVRALEHVLLKNITLDIPAGSHVAIVGTSGAGKSTLIGLLLGWHYPDSGQLLIDNQPLTYDRLLQLRQETAWVDPNIQLWNRSLLYNLYYADQQVPLNIVVEQADLRGLLERLEDGLQTPLGSEGRLLSGGQGQRVRFGRALQRQNARLVILDEAFRGLDRSKRRALLARARQFWSKSTLICVTHDVGQTLDFERVLVMDNGQLIEDGDPLTLAKQPESRYAALLAAEKNVHDKLWSKHNWRRLWLDGGQLTDR